jgi:hypothetical protein
VPHAQRGGQQLRRQPGDRHDRHDDHGVPLTRAGRQAADAKLVPDAAVGGVDPGEQQHQQRDHQHDQPGAVRELGDRDEQRCDRGQDRPGAVDGGTPPPAPASFAPPVPDHPDLAQEEPDEHADREQRHEQVDLAPAEQQQPSREDGQHADAVTVHEPVRP